MKRNYLILAIIGFILPNIFVFKVMLETGNILLWTDIPTTFNSMFANDIASAFMVDLFFIVVLFMIWSFLQARKHRIKNLWAFWLFTFAFGIAGGLPLFLYFREKQIETNEAAAR